MWTIFKLFFLIDEKKSCWSVLNWGKKQQLKTEVVVTFGCNIDITGIFLIEQFLFLHQRIMVDEDIFALLYKMCLLLHPINVKNNTFGFEKWTMRTVHINFNLLIQMTNQHSTR